MGLRGVGVGHGLGRAGPNWCVGSQGRRQGFASFQTPKRRRPAPTWELWSEMLRPGHPDPGQGSQGFTPRSCWPLPKARVIVSHMCRPDWAAGCPESG